MKLRHREVRWPAQDHTSGTRTHAQPPHPEPLGNVSRPCFCNNCLFPHQTYKSQIRCTPNFPQAWNHPSGDNYTRQHTTLSGQATEPRRRTSQPYQWQVWASRWRPESKLRMPEPWTKLGLCYKCPNQHHIYKEFQYWQKWQGPPPPWHEPPRQLHQHTGGL